MKQQAMTIFLDVEWSQSGNEFILDKCQMLQIAGICVYENTGAVKTFSKSIRPDDIESIAFSTLKLIGTNANTLLNADTKETVFNKFFLSFGNIKTIIVWNRCAYELFMHDALRMGMKVRNHKLIVVQKLVEQISNIGVISFEKMLKLLNIEYKKDLLYHAKHDVVYLKKLYDAICKEFDKACEESEIKFYKTQKTKLVHAFECRYVDSDYVYNQPEEGVLYGNCICKICSRNNAFKIMNWDRKMIKTETKTKKQSKVSNKVVRLTEQYINSLCDKYRLDGRVGVEGMLFISTGRTNWRIYYDQWEVVSVYHENYMPKNKEYQEKISANIGFHRQNIGFKSLDKVLAYIKSHDRGNIVKHEKNRIDKLFEKIERNEGIKELSFC